MVVSCTLAVVGTFPTDEVNENLPFSAYVPDFDTLGGIYPTAFYSWAHAIQKPSVPPDIVCVDGTVTVETYRTTVTLSDGGACPITVTPQQNDDTYQHVVYTGTLSRSGNIYSLTNGTICGTPYTACPPTALSATVASANQINLSWTLTPAAEATTTYKIYQDGALKHTTAANATTYNVTGLTCNTEYAFTVVATNTGGDSTQVATTPVTTTTAACSTPIPASILDFTQPIVIFSKEIKVTE